MTAEIQTEKGTMKVELYENDAPNTIKKSFVDLSKKGYYDGLNFHRVIPNFVIQGGCLMVLEMAVRYSIDCELDGDNQYHDRGVLSMAHAGRNTGGSQFFYLSQQRTTAHLDKNHTCFGRVVEGLDVIDDIRQGDKIEKNCNQ